MAEELSPESKLYVKEEIEKMRKEFKEDLKEANSKATRIFATIALIVGLLASVGVYGGIITIVEKKLDAKALADFENNQVKLTAAVKDANSLVEVANSSYKNIADILAKANNDLSDLMISKLKSHQLAAPNGYAWVGGIKFVWGTVKSSKQTPEFFKFEHPFRTKCFTVIPNLPGDVSRETTTQFAFDRHDDYKSASPYDFSYVAIGN